MKDVVDPKKKTAARSVNILKQLGAEAAPGPDELGLHQELVEPTYGAVAPGQPPLNPEDFAPSPALQRLAKRKPRTPGDPTTFLEKPPVPGV